jgi:hypothetical protein
LSSWWFSWKNCHFVGRFFDFVIILRPITMYQDYLNCPCRVRGSFILPLIYIISFHNIFLFGRNNFWKFQPFWN